MTVRLTVIHYLLCPCVRRVIAADGSSIVQEPDWINPPDDLAVAGFEKVSCLLGDLVLILHPRIGMKVERFAVLDGFC